MKQLFMRVKKLSALTLVFMLTISMFNELLLLSASADEENTFPIIENEPVMAYRQEGYLSVFDREFNTGNYFNDFMGTLQTIDILMDDSGSEKKLSDIVNISYSYNDPILGEFDGDVPLYNYIEGFDLLLVNICTNIFAEDSIAARICGEPHNISLPNFKGYDYSDFVVLTDSLKRSELKLYVYYNDDSCQSIPVKNVMETGRSEYIIDHTTGAVALEFAHCTNINDKSFYELGNAISNYTDVYEGRSGRIYVDIETNDPIRIPLDNMSSRVTLEQTRIGDNIIYNTKRSVDFGDDSVPGFSNNTSDAGDVYTWNYNEKSYAANEIDCYDVYCTLSDYGSYILKRPSLKYNDELFGLDYTYVDTIYSIDFLNQGKVVNGSLFTGIPGTEFDQSVIDDLTKRLSYIQLYILYNNNSAINTEEKVLDFLTALKDYYESESISQSDKDVLNKIGIRIKCTQKSYNREYETKLYVSMSPDSLHSIDWVIDKINSNDKTDYYNFNFIYDIVYDGYSNKSETTIEPLKDFAAFIGNYDSDSINANGSYMPDIDNIQLVSFLDLFNVSKRIDTIKKPLVHSNANKVGITYKDSYDEIYAMKEKCAENVTRDEHAVITDTYNSGTNEIVFSYDDLDDIEEGTIYNVVNQVSITANNSSVSNNNLPDGAFFNNYYDSTTIRSDGSQNDYHRIYNGNVYAVNGEFIVTAETGFSVSRSENNSNSNVNVTTNKQCIMKHTEYKWGEIVFGRRPESVEDLTLDNNTNTLSWRTSEPTDTSDVPTHMKDDGIRINRHIIRIYDLNGNKIFEQVLNCQSAGQLKFTLPDWILSNYDILTINVSCGNAIGESDPSEINYKNAEESGILEIPYGTTKIEDYEYANRTDIKTVIIPETVTSIGNNAFSGCTNITCVKVPDSVISIGDNAFKSCNNLISIKLPEGLTSIGNSAFEFCYNLISIELPDGLISIGNNAFKYCSELESIIIPDSVTSLGEYVFYGCSDLSEAVLPDSLTVLNDDVFGGCISLNAIELPKRLTSIGNWTFGGCETLSKIELPGSVTSIGEYAFNCCIFTSIQIPQSVTIIGEGAFSQCDLLKEVYYYGSTDDWNNITIREGNDCLLNAQRYCDGDYTTIIIPYGTTRIEDYSYCNRMDINNVFIPDTVTEIGSCAFADCINLKSITLPDSVTSIGNSAFANCDSLTSIEIPGSVENIGSGVFSGCDKLKDVTMQNGVSSVGDSMFGWCKSLTDVEIPNSVTCIETSAFYDCDSLTNINIPNHVTSIGDYAFCGCDNLTSIRIPSSVTSIGRTDYSTGSVFGDCKNLISIDVDSGNPKYASRDGVLYDNAITTLLRCPEGKASVSIPVDVKTIFLQSFKNCKKITSIEIPRNVMSIDDSAFYSCSALTDINVDPNNNYYTSVDGVLYSKSITTLIKCPEGKSIDVIPNGVKNIAYGAFGNCKNLASLVIPDSVTSIGGGTFENCENLTEITLSKNLTIIPSDMFNTCKSLASVEIPVGVTKIEERAFYECDSLTSISIPNGVTEIQCNAFNSCDNLEFVEIPSSVTAIGFNQWTNKENPSDVFSGCMSLNSINVDEENTRYADVDGVLYNKELTELYVCPPAKETVSIPESVTCIKTSAFSNCKQLTDIGIPNSVTSIEPSAFSYCESLLSVSIPDSVTKIENCTFYGCKNIRNIEIPNTVTVIGGGAFIDCENLSEITIPDSVTSIEGSAFTNCSSLERIELSNSIVTIESVTFSNCSSLRYIEIPESVTRIGFNAFLNCTGLQSIELHENVKEIGYAAFLGCTDLTDVYYYGSVDDWNAMTINSANQCLSDANIHYNYVKPSESDETPDNPVPDTSDTPYGEKPGTLIIPYGTTRIESWEYYNRSDLKEVIIPDTVTSIGVEAFGFCRNITRIVLPDSLKEIDESAFYMCSSLEEICIPKGVKDIIGNIFIGCTSLASIDVDSENQYYTSYEGVMYNKNMTELIACPGAKTIVIIPNGVLSINNDAFGSCNVQTVILPESLTTIGDFAFSDCYKLEELFIPENVSSLGYRINIWGKIKNIIVDENNNFYTSLDGIVYNKDMTELILCPGGRINDVVVPDGVIRILGSAFCGCSMIKNVYLPKSISYIEDCAFYGCCSLTDVYYAGSSSLWNSIVMSSYNDSLLSAEIHYTPDNVETSDVPDNPETSDTPDYPDNPETADTPDYPDNPETADTPDCPDNPETADTPDYPDNPETADTPDYPDNPETADTPDCPDNLETADTPDYHPDNPETPDTPDYPNNTETSDTPDKPDDRYRVGDVNGDNKITAADALIILRSSVNLETLDDKQRLAADIDEDGYITASDSLDILLFTIGRTFNCRIGGYAA